MKSSFNSFVIKECRHIIRERRTLVMLFAIPLLLVMLFGYVISTDISHTPIAIYDQSHGDPVARRVIQSLDATTEFEVIEYINSADQIDAAFKRGRVRMVVVIPENIGSKIVRTGDDPRLQLICDASDLNTSTTIESYATAIVASVNQQLNPAGDNPPVIRTQVRMVYNPELQSAYMFVPGVMALIVMIVSAMMTSVTLAREKEQGTLRLLTVSPLKPRVIVLAKVVPYFFLAAINTVMIMLLGVFLFGMPCHGSIWAVALLSGLFILSAIGMGLLISALVSTQQAALTASQLGLFLPTVLLSGFIFPISNMPFALQIFTNVVPATWFVSGIKDLMLKGVPITDVWLQLLVLAVMSVVFIGIALLLFIRDSRPKA